MSGCHGWVRSSWLQRQVVCDRPFFTTGLVGHVLNPGTSLRNNDRSHRGTSAKSSGAQKTSNLGLAVHDPMRTGQCHATRPKSQPDQDGLHTTQTQHKRQFADPLSRGAALRCTAHLCCLIWNLAANRSTHCQLVGGTPELLSVVLSWTMATRLPGSLPGGPAKMAPAAAPAPPIAQPNSEVDDDGERSSIMAWIQDSSRLLFAHGFLLLRPLMRMRFVAWKSPVADNMWVHAPLSVGAQGWPGLNPGILCGGA